MENPNTWRTLENIISNAMQDHYLDETMGYYGFSVVRRVADAIRKSISDNQIKIYNSSPYQLEDIRSIKDQCFAAGSYDAVCGTALKELLDERGSIMEIIK